MLKIALVGEMRTGKDEICKYIRSKNRDVMKVCFSSGITELLKEFFPEVLKTNNKPRKYYQEIGQFMRTINKDVWVNYLEKELQLHSKHGFNSFVCTDLRQYNEYTFLKSKGFYIVKVVADKENRINRMNELGDNYEMDALNHETEQNINKIPYDYLINNNGTLEELYKQVDTILKEIEIRNIEKGVYMYE